MTTAPFAVAVLLLAPSLEAQALQTTLAPTYSTASITNAATNLPSGFAPNSIVAIYGANLAFGTEQGSVGAYLPTSVGGVTVLFGSTPGNIFFVSPQQINALIPYDFLPGPITVTVLRQGSAGPAVPITLTATSPGLFQTGPNTVLAVHANNSLITASAPARPGEIIIVYAIGLGYTNPDLINGVVPVHPARIVSGLSVLLNGVALDPVAIQYAGISPGCAGLYQINVQLPASLPPNPELRVAAGQQISPPLLKLFTQ